MILMSLTLGIFGTLITLYLLLTLGFLQTSLKPCVAEPPATKKKSSRLFCSYCKKANHTVDTCRSVPGTVTILNGGGQVAPTGCTFRLATGRVEKKKNKKKLAEKVMEQVEAMQLE
ncbi:hypothetical protein FMEXI_8474 [Fusarium mexicanum]|uniref:Uncharacterized protein n=1 Tax=Fusarium mexicanum TaxID=751941 RepID=A0A8H5MS34_9HYPO|nr:hypothetical protein FMEXI_8474 [Fusarium mexicanum]